ncbi:MAG TPA: MBL fold metallo-hydrolase [Acidimicrobiales bacterium]
MGLSITVLGCDGTYAGPGGACSGYLVEGGGTAVWLDAGPGTLANLQRHVGLADVDAVVVSHGHPDHWLELPVFHNALKYGLGRKGFPVYAPRAVRRQADSLGSTKGTFDWRVVGDGDEATIGGLSFRFSRTDHPVETLGVRVDGDGRSLAYSADTSDGWSLGELGPGVDLAVCEATLLADREGTAPHLSGRQAGAMAKAAGVARLVLTHLWPTSDPDRHRAEAEAAFGGPVEVAELHRRYDA